MRGPCSRYRQEQRFLEVALTPAQTAGRHQDRLTKPCQPRGFVRGGSDDGELEAFSNADVAVHHITAMQCQTEFEDDSLIGVFGDQARSSSAASIPTKSAAGMARASGAHCPAHCAPKPNSPLALPATCSAFPRS